MDVSHWLVDKEHGALVDYSALAAAPCKDFYHIFVTSKDIVLRWWKIVPPHRSDSHAPPSEMKNSYDDFLVDERCHSEVVRLAGSNILNYLIRLAEGKLDYISRLPDNVLKLIILDLPLEDSLRLSQTSKQFRQLCNDDDVWEKIFRREVETPVTPELVELAEREGWKRLFYTNKLQLQLHLRRQKREQHEAQQAFLTQGQSEEGQCEQTEQMQM